MKRLACLALASIALVGCQAAPPQAPVNCDALYAEFAKASGVHDYFVARQGDLGPDTTTAYEHMMAVNDRVQESCK